MRRKIKEERTKGMRIKRMQIRRMLIKKIMLAGVLLLCLMGSACAGDREMVSEQNGPVFFTYETEGTIYCFTVDDDGVIFVCGEEENTGYNRIISYDREGKEVYRWTAQDKMWSSIETITVYNGKVYFSCMSSEKERSIYELDMATGDCTVFCELPGFTKVRKICISRDNMFLLGNNVSVPMSTGSSGGQNPGNTRLYVLDLKEKEISRQFPDNAIGISDMPDGNIMMYAYDEEKGYIFAGIDAESTEIIDITPKQIEGIDGFAFDGKGLIFYSPSATRISYLTTISYSLLTESGVAGVMPNMAAANDSGIYFRNGFTYVWNGLDGKIERLKNSVYIKENREIRMIGSSVYASTVFFAGYSTVFEEKTDEELSLAVLSNDRNFDVFYMGSRQSMAKNLKENGVYYPLNDVPYVKEYLESCFPYIETAATDKDGNIWMIPLNVDIPVLIYNEEKCKSAGVDFASADTPEKLLDGIKTCRESREYDYWFNGYSFIHSNMRTYLRTNTVFDTEEFRRLALNMKEAYCVPYGSSSVTLDYMMGTGNVSFSSQEGPDTQTYDSLMYSDDERARSLSSFDGEANSAVCTYICVNPASDNLDTVLDCISALCEYKLSIDNYCLFSDKSRYPESRYAESLYNIYENGVIDFIKPEEIYWPDLKKYMEGEMALDDMIRESDRRMQVYLNE